MAECIGRLLDPGEIGLDIGANIGQMTGLMRSLVGPQGQVVSFEPHPELFSELSENMACYSGPAVGTAQLHKSALSDKPGKALLDVGPHWQQNRGNSHIVAGEETSATSTKIPVPLETLDAVLEPKAQIGVCKIDVEGHELSVFKGAEKTFQRRAIRDLIFEDFEDYPSEAQKFLLERGFTIFSLHSSLLKPKLKPVVSKPSFNLNKEGENYLATLEPERAISRLKSFGWKVLR